MNADNMDFRAGVEVVERDMTPEEAMFFAGVMRDVPHSRGEKVVKLTAPPPVEWELQK